MPRKKSCCHLGVVEIYSEKGCKNPILVRVCSLCGIVEKTPPGFKKLKKSRVIKRIKECELWENF